ncbi:MAG: hypothetical protein HY042_09005, partial [Spirochaetia bacterium]|nr:hypothetical protein [Spirochaetia bacterium]
MHWQVIHIEALNADPSACRLPWVATRGPVCLAVDQSALKLLSPPPDKGPFPLGILARYNRAHPEIPAETLLGVLGMKTHFKNVADWKEMGALDEDVSAFGRDFDFAIDVLRLFQRLTLEERNAWISIWRARGVRRNLIRDIILDYYDLTPALRAQVLVDCAAFAENWAARSGVFPAEELRDMVRSRRFPMVTKAKQELHTLQAALQFPRGTTL